MNKKNLPVTQILKQVQDDDGGRSSPRFRHPELVSGSIKKALILLALSSAFALTLAYISQFIFDYQPCILCLYQRKPFFAVIAATMLCLTFFKSEKSKRITFFCCLGFLLINCALSFYHVGVEKKIFQGPTTCSSTNLDEIDNLEDLKAAMMKTKAIRCDEPSFVFLSLSMAAWNFLYCSFLVFVSLLFYRYGKKIGASHVTSNLT